MRKAFVVIVLVGIVIGLTGVFTLSTNAGPVKPQISMWCEVICNCGVTEGHTQCRYLSGWTTCGEFCAL
jgi:hypothetical protein